MKLLFILVALASFVARSQQQQCRINEVYKECGGCDQYCNEGPVFCAADCNPGCYCQEGFQRSFRGGICIPISTCKLMIL
ncbi:hypothetical protein AVEN_19258-1 [Araneus ventricosus]|uniref:TIL domain-containing protein n=1 Tax=Araneus ventricosus TaxID=182803 RepID=A0A4Y2KZK9_ARAVE|nr:hypothetical protein AVEN_19258-1 [Araneus ventricosus]